MMLARDFFARDTILVAKDLLGKVLRSYHNGMWLSVMIIETEAYYLVEKGSHASLGMTNKRQALFMKPGTIYMYYSRAGDSMNVSCEGAGNAVLIKSGIPYLKQAPENMLEVMQKSLKPLKNKARSINYFCSGQTLLCRCLGLKVPVWDKKTFDSEQLRIDDVGYRPEKIIQTTRLGIPKGRDEHLPYRFIDYQYAKFCTNNPMTKRNLKADQDYLILELSPS